MKKFVPLLFQWRNVTIEWTTPCLSLYENTKFEISWTETMYKDIILYGMIWTTDWWIIQSMEWQACCNTQSTDASLSSRRLHSRRNICLSSSLLVLSHNYLNTLTLYVNHCLRKLVLLWGAKSCICSKLLLFFCPLTPFNIAPIKISGVDLFVTLLGCDISVWSRSTRDWPINYAAF